MAGFEELDDDTANFFKSNGEDVSEALKAEIPEPKAAEPEEVTPTKTTPAADPVVAPPNQTEELLRNLVEAQQEQTRRMQAQLDSLNAKLAEAAKPAPVAEVVPDKANDPLGYLLYAQEKLAAEIAAERERVGKASETATQQASAREVLTTIDNQINAFRATHPDYDAAYALLKNTRAADFKDMGMGPREIQEAIGNEEVRIIQQAMQTQKNPAEIVYALAQRYGHKPAAATVATKTGTPETAASKLDAIRKGQQAADGVQRAVPPSEITIRAVKEMSASQLNDAIENNWDQLMGVNKKSGIF